MSDPTKGFGSLRDGYADVVISPNVKLKRKRFAADRLDLAGDGRDGPRQFRMWLVGLGCDHDVRAVCGRFERDRPPDPTTATSDEDGLSAQICHGCISFI
jgi:hypothetical protein